MVGWVERGSCIDKADDERCSSKSLRLPVVEGWHLEKQEQVTDVLR